MRRAAFVAFRILAVYLVVFGARLTPQIVSRVTRDPSTIAWVELFMDALPLASGVALWIAAPSLARRATDVHLLSAQEMRAFIALADEDDDDAAPGDTRDVDAGGGEDGSNRHTPSARDWPLARVALIVLGTYFALRGAVDAVTGVGDFVTANRSLFSECGFMNAGEECPFWTRYRVTVTVGVVASLVQGMVGVLLVARPWSCVRFLQGRFGRRRDQDERSSISQA